MSPNAPRLIFNGNATTPEVYEDMRRDWHLMARKFTEFHPADPRPGSG